jgi:UMF1 family MFS transporter
VRISFLTVAVWWVVFSLPLLLVVRERPALSGTTWGAALRGGLSQFAQTLREIRALRAVALFLVAYWLYIDGVDTIIRMAVDYGMALGFDPESLIVALLLVQFVGFPAAIAFGYLGERIGTKPAIFIAIGVYVGVSIWAYFLSNEREFYMMAVAIGLVQGGIQSLSRSYYARLIPAEKSAEFFGFYNMLGKFAAVIGPLLVGWTAAVTGSSRASILSVIILFVLGALFLYFVPSPESAQKPASAPE